MALKISFSKAVCWSCSLRCSFSSNRVAEFFSGAASLVSGSLRSRKLCSLDGSVSSERGPEGDQEKGKRTLCGPALYVETGW
jgi:hypothetical protein